MAIVREAEAPGMFSSPTCYFRTLQPIQIWSLGASPWAFPPPFSVSTENQASNYVSRQEGIINIILCGSFINNRNRRYVKSVFFWQTSRCLGILLLRKTGSFSLNPRPSREQPERHQASPHQRSENSNCNHHFHPLQLTKILNNVIDY